MKLLLDANGNVVVRNNRPVYVKDDGAEVEFDVVGTTQTIARLNNEAKSHRERAERAEATASTWADYKKEDVDAALALASDVKGNKLVKEGKLDELKNELNGVWQKKFDAEHQRAEEATKKLHSTQIGYRFANSKFVKDKLETPVDLLQSYFGPRFKYDPATDRVVGHHPDGSPIRSNANPGEIAEFDEALELVVSQHPSRDSMYKADQRGGGGSQNKGGQQQKNTMSRADFERQTPAEKAKFARGGGKIVD